MNKNDQRNFFNDIKRMLLAGTSAYSICFIAIAIIDAVITPLFSIGYMPVIIQMICIVVAVLAIVRTLDNISNRREIEINRDVQIIIEQSEMRLEVIKQLDELCRDVASRYDSELELRYVDKRLQVIQSPLFNAEVQ